MSIIDMQAYRDKKAIDIPSLNSKVMEASINLAILQFRITAMLLTTTLLLLDTMSDYFRAIKLKGIDPV